MELFFLLFRSSFSHDLQNKLSYQSIEQCYVAQAARASYPGLHDAALAACPLIPDIRGQSNAKPADVMHLLLAHALHSLDHHYHCMVLKVWHSVVHIYASLALQCVTELIRDMNKKMHT